jgi:ATP-dependent helicase/nuclease subunit B
MDVVFGAAFDARVWPGPLRGRSHDDGVLDEAWVGPHGLVALLETQLGLTSADVPSQADRAAALAKRLQQTPGLWSRSVEVDAYASAQRVLSWRDGLLEAGLDPRTSRAPPRVAVLLQMTRAIPPGLVDRAWNICRLLEAGASHRVRSLARTDAMLAPLWVQLCERVCSTGARAATRATTRVAHHDPPQPHNDLDRLRTALTHGGPLQLEGDGSAWLTRPADEMTAAEDVAMALAVAPQMPTVIVGATPILDAALARYGLPTLGVRGPGVHAADAWLGLVTALARTPPDVHALADLCQLPDGPIPRRMAQAIRRALAQQPSCQSTLVRDAWRSELAKLPERRAAELEARLECLWPDACDAPTGDVRYRIDGLRARVSALRAWLIRRIAVLTDEDTIDLCQTQRERCDHYLSVLSLQEGDDLNESQHRRMLTLVMNEHIEPRATRAQAGIVHVADARHVTAPVPRIVWWQFWQERPDPPSLGVGFHLGDDEPALHALGCRPLTAAARAQQRRHAWERLVHQAQHHLWMVAPRVDASGDPRVPHALMDVWLAVGGERALMPISSDSDGKSSLADRVRAWRVERVPDVAGYRAWPLDGLTSAQPLETTPTQQASTQQAPTQQAQTSPAEEEVLLGCSLRSFLDGRFQRQRQIPSLTRSLGTLQHAVLADVLRDFDVCADAAHLEDRVRDALAKRWHDHDDRMLHPTEATRRASVLLQLQHAVRMWQRLMRDNDLRMVHVEESVQREGKAAIMRGRPDVVLTFPSGQRLVIDHKTGTDVHNEQKILDGNAVQLLLYSWLVSEHQALANAGFAQVRSGRFFLMGQATLRHTTPLPTPPMEQQLRALWVGLKQRRDERKRGLLLAPGAHADTMPRASSSVGAKELSVKPPCGDCTHASVCGHNLAGVSS